MGVEQSHRVGLPEALGTQPHPGVSRKWHMESREMILQLQHLMPSLQSFRLAWDLLTLSHCLPLPDGVEYLSFACTPSLYLGRT